MPIGFTAPRIEPVPAGTERPLWSVMIPTFNRLQYLDRTLESVLAQDPGRDQMQIQVVDDCSTTENPEPIVRRLAGDRVTITRNPQNLGLMRNFNKCIEQARGHLVQILHSDDYVEPTFYSVLGELAARYPDCAFLASRVFEVDQTEVIVTVSPRLKWMETPTCNVTPMLSTGYFQCPGVVVRRAFYEQYGGFIPELVYCADWEMWVRAVHYGGGVVHCQPLASWRRSADHESANLARSGQNIRDFLRLNDHFSRYPGFSASALCDEAIWTALNQYRRFAARGDVAAAHANLQLYRELVPLPVRTIRNLLDGLQHAVRSVKRFVKETTRPVFRPQSKVEPYRN